VVIKIALKDTTIVLFPRFARTASSDLHVTAILEKQKLNATSVRARMPSAGSRDVRDEFSAEAGPPMSARKVRAQVRDPRRAQLMSAIGGKVDIDQCTK
jgi:hypothetical protein